MFYLTYSLVIIFIMITSYTTNNIHIRSQLEIVTLCLIVNFVIDINLISNKFLELFESNDELNLQTYLNMIDSNKTK